MLADQVNLESITHSLWQIVFGRLHKTCSFIKFSAGLLRLSNTQQAASLRLLLEERVKLQFSV